MTTTRFTHNGGVPLAYEDLGGAGGEPLLLVMGLGTSRFWWPDGLVRELVARGFHVAAYDQRDAGESGRVTAPPAGHPVSALLRRTAPAYRAEDLTDDAVAVLDALGWPCAHLFGHSLGGLVAQRVAIRHPERVSTLTSSSAMPSDAGPLDALRHVRPGPVLRMGRLHFPDTPEGNLALAVAVARILAAPERAVGPEDVREFVDREAAHDVASFRDAQAQSRQIGAKWSGGPLARIAAPTLALHAERDPLIRPSAARALAAAAPNARLRVMPGAGHLLTREHWAPYADELHAHALNN
ncbi:alpha/beta fold hydrolase [Kitasatospora sp. CB02891]|uniref:alpha/beta fold hydrolase n=1 Tax=Kitasatospora sp. CB02891 TaxID=2020329 RepID=UPI000C27E279|nr:alpha/beta hydrolase [Kitasatospora sp. CB02891]PJN25407.1 alpha/beta hydrolase [Kitasatospora sp. CB02891]